MSTQNDKEPDGGSEPEGSHVRIFDTTLRDGEQAPGFTMSVDQKIRMAEALRDINVDVIEAGFAAASPGDEEAVRRIASEIEGPVICSLSRSGDDDIRAAARSLEPAAKSRIHIFLGTSPIHRQAKLNMTCDEVLAATRNSVNFARTFFDDVEFSPEDAIRTEREFLVAACETAIEAGATTINVPDTVGYTTPDEIYELFKHLRENVRGMNDVVLSAHCHDDLGMAVANSISAVRAGARQVEVAVNGIGERAGNCSLEEVVMAMRTRSDVFNVKTGVDTRGLYSTSQLLAALTGNPVPRNKAIVGRNAFAHEAGIHQHGMIQDPSTYEIMKPEDVGSPGTQLVLGKHSGRHALVQRAELLGAKLDGNVLPQIFYAFKNLADEVGEVNDNQLLELIHQYVGVRA